MLFGTYKEDEAYLWKKFRAPEFDPATGIDQETAGEKLAAEAALCAAEKGADFAMNKFNGPETVAS